MEQCILGDIFSLAYNQNVHQDQNKQKRQKLKKMPQLQPKQQSSASWKPEGSIFSLTANWSISGPTNQQLQCVLHRAENTNAQNTPHQLTRSLNAVQICSAKQQNATCSTISTFHNYNLLLNKFNSSSTAIPNTFKMKYIFNKQSAQHSWCSIWASVAVGHNECSCKVVCGEAKHTLLGGKKKVMHQTQLPHPPQQGRNFPAGNYMYNFYFFLDFKATYATLDDFHHRDFFHASNNGHTCSYFHLLCLIQKLIAQQELDMISIFCATMYYYSSSDRQTFFYFSYLRLGQSHHKPHHV